MPRRCGSRRASCPAGAEQVRLREAGARRARRAGPARSRCGRRMPRPRSRRARSRRTPPGAAAAAAARRAPRWPSARRLRSPSASTRPVTPCWAPSSSSWSKTCVDHVVGLHAGEERHGLAGDDGDDRGDRLRLERLHQLRAAVGVGGGEHETAVACAHEPLERSRASVLDCSLHDRPQHDDDRDGAREFERGAEGRVIRLEDDPIARHRRGARRARLGAAAAGAARARTGRRRRAGCCGGIGVGHGISDAPIRLSDQPRRRILSRPSPTPGT